MAKTTNGPGNRAVGTTRTQRFRKLSSRCRERVRLPDLRASRRQLEIPGGPSRASIAIRATLCVHGHRAFEVTPRSRESMRLPCPSLFFQFHGQTPHGIKRGSWTLRPAHDIALERIEQNRRERARRNQLAAILPPPGPLGCPSPEVRPMVGLPPGTLSPPGEPRPIAVPSVPVGTDGTKRPAVVARLAPLGRARHPRAPPRWLPTARSYTRSLCAPSVGRATTGFKRWAGRPWPWAFCPSRKRRRAPSSRHAHRPPYFRAHGHRCWIGWIPSVEREEATPPPGRGPR